ncbi:BadF/BadG/BcrA/BcrD ATPase family protein, partial [Streptomyces sp. URMC 128]|uniref:N-acetylglucosamine kinase n=1 Tax=Streptomyces sp. URMC 128 TaxID=3423404 RepID=UPI003F1ACA13
MGNELNQERQGASALVIGIDAGGTRTRAVLATADDGHPVGEGAAGPGNALTVPLQQLTEHLAEAVGRAVPEPVRDRVVAVAGGFAGASGTAADEPGRRNASAALTAALHRLGIDAGPPVIGSDIEAAFASAPGTPADGLALVAGTGAVAMRITDRRATVTVDGDGWLLGDDGSGFWIGRAAVRAALRMADGRGAPTLLAEVVGRELGLPGDVLPGGGTAGGAVRRLSPDVVPGTAEGTPRDGRQEGVPPVTGPSAAGGRPAGPGRSGGAGVAGEGPAGQAHGGAAGGAGGRPVGPGQAGAGGPGQAGVGRGTAQSGVAKGPEQAGGALPGVAGASVVDDEANEVPNGGGGYLVLTEPWPS